MDKKSIGITTGLGMLVIGLIVYLVKGNDKKFKEVLEKMTDFFKKPFAKVTKAE